VPGRAHHPAAGAALEHLGVRRVAHVRAAEAPGHARQHVAVPGGAVEERGGGQEVAALAVPRRELLPRGRRPGGRPPRRAGAARVRPAARGGGERDEGRA
jgi:hypothetical protein